MQTFGVRRELIRSESWLHPNRNRLLDGQHRVELSNAQPQVPILKTGSFFVEQANARQTSTAEYDTRAGNKIRAQQLPEDVALRTCLRVEVSAWATLVVANRCSPINEACVRSSLKQVHLYIDRPGK